ncbi:hypothetical protein ABPG72_006180 [Tetrahymena utriculariae]
MEFDEFEDDFIGGDAGEGGDQAQGFDFQENEFIPDLISKKDAVIFLIDCNKKIFQNEFNDEVQFKVILKSIQSFFKSKIISSLDDQVSVIFYNVKQTNNDLNFKGINIVYNLNTPSAEMIKNVVKLGDNFERDFGFADNQTPFHEALWTCNSIFTKLDSKKFIMRIFLFTNNDQPHQDNKDFLDKCFNQARTLAEKNIQIELFPLATRNQKFDIRKFYSSIITFDVDEINEAVIDTSDKVLDIQHRLRQKEYKKRAVNRLLFSLGDETRLGVKLFCPYVKQKRPLAKQLESNTNKLLKRTVKNICKETGQSLYQNQISTCVHIGGEKIKVSKNDINEIKAFEEPGMRLIGFKPAGTLKAYHNYRTSYFVYPDDYHVKGSSQSFHALISQMIAKDKIAIVRFIPRKGTQVRFCALLPQEESYDEDHVQTPPGFHLIFLPYADDQRNLGSIRPQQKEEVSRNLLNAAKMMCNALDLANFDFRNFEDPSLQKFFAHLQAHALQEQNPENPPDLIQPDEEGMKRCEDIIKLFEEALKLDVQDDDQPQAAQKKPRQKKAEKPAVEKQPAQNKQPAQKKAPQKKKLAKKEEESEASSIGDYDSEDSFIDDEEEDIKPKKRGVQNKNMVNSRRANKKIEYSEEEDDGISYEEKPKRKAGGKKQMSEEEKLISHVESNLKEEFNPDSLTISELKQYLKMKGLKNIGKKEELVDTILRHLERN